MRMGWSLHFDAALHFPERLVPVSSVADLRDHLASLIERGYGGAMLRPNDRGGDCLYLGVEGGLAFVQYTKFTRTMYEIRFASTGRDSGEPAVEFNIGNTPTEVPPRLCIPADVMRRIAEHYVEHRELPDWVPWDFDRP